MADPRFFANHGPFSAGALAELAGARLDDAADPERAFADVAPIEAAGQQDVTFLDNRRYLRAFAESAAGACLVHPAFAARAPAGMTLLLTEQPYRGYALVARAFYPPAPPEPGIAPGARVDPTAEVDPTASIADGAVVGARAEIGARCRIEPNAVIGRAVRIGDDTRIGAGATLSHCLIGRRVYVYPGARIGQEGFGFVPGRDGPLTIPQLGRVIVEDDVEIGANVCIDRGSGPDTIVRRGCMIDNLVQIGHNVEVGAGSIIVAQAGIAGSTKLEEGVSLAAQGGLAGHLRVGAGARIAAKSGVMRDVAPGEEVCGAPAIPVKQFWRLQVKLQRLLEEKGK
jgi:UDP-3-O-[3-hydroxymyristoyl] glucosamine N-acyltransferase